MVHYKLHYFPARGRGEFIRYIFAQADVPYDDNRIPLEEFRSKLKSNYEFGVIPVLDVDGKSLAQSLAIGRYLAEKYNLAGSNEWNKATADMIVHFIEDIYPKGMIPILKAHMSKDEKAKIEAWEKFRDTVIDPMFEKFEKLLGDKKWFCGDDLTWADLSVGELSDRCERCFETNYMSKFPKLQEHMNRVHKLPNIKKYISTRPDMAM